MPDHRGRVAYDKTTQASRTVDELGEIADGETFDAPPSRDHQWTGATKWRLPLARVKAARRAEVDAELVRRNAEGFMHLGVRYQLDDASQMRITALGALAGLSPADWLSKDRVIAADNSQVSFTPAGLVAFAAAAARTAIRRRRNARALKDAINAAGDVPAVAAVDITTGWV